MKNETMQKIAEKVLMHMEMEKLMNTEVGKLLDINPAYLSLIKRRDQYDKCPMKAWRKMHVWYHSGSNLRDYDHTKAPEVPDVHPTEEATETIPEIKQTGVPKPEPVAEKGKPPTEEKPPKEKEPIAPPPPPIPEQTDAGDAMTIEAQSRKIVIEPKPKGKPGRKPRDKGEGSPYGKYEKPAPSQEEIERVLATLGIEIEVVVKLKNKKTDE
jgi:hypothetical protein